MGSNCKQVYPLIETLLMWSIDHTTGSIALTTGVARTNGRWQYGLLTGQSSKGEVQFIGKIARQRARQQELATLALEITTLRSNFEERTHYLIQREAQYEKFSVEQDEIRTLLERTGLSVSHHGLKITYASLSSAHKNYKEAQEQTRKKRQEYNQLTMKLVKQSGSIIVFTHEHEKVQIALRETYKIGPQANLLQQELQALATLHKEMHGMRQSVLDAKIDRDENETIYSTLQDQLVRYISILEGLQEIMDAPETKDLTQKLEQLHTQAKQLDKDILTATKDISTFAERTRSLSESVIQKEAELQTALASMRQKQTLFRDSLSTYPVPELQEARILVDEGKYAKAVQPLQIDVDTLENLQQKQLDFQSALDTMHKKYMGMLHEYAPDLDRKTYFITFSQEKGVTPFELLSQLDSNRKKQQELLKIEEVKLFESFLLRRMTEVLHKYIQEAKEWVDKMNEPLRKMSTVQDHYELEWQAVKPRPEEARLGSYLAKQQKLFGKPLSKLTEQERELLIGAFRQEINVSGTIRTKVIAA